MKIVGKKPKIEFEKQRKNAKNGHTENNKNFPKKNGIKQHK